MEQDKFESWAVVEIFGHQTFAGFVTEQTIGGCSFIRVDVPDTPAVEGQYSYQRRDAQPAFSKLFGQGAIYSITPCTEDLARATANLKRSRALEVIGMPDYNGTRQIESADDEDYDDRPSEPDVDEDPLGILD